jgi:hypothetical protein
MRTIKPLWPAKAMPIPTPSRGMGAACPTNLGSNRVPETCAANPNRAWYEDPINRPEQPHSRRPDPTWFAAARSGASGNGG